MIDMMVRNEDRANVRHRQPGRAHLPLHAVARIEQIDRIADTSAFAG